MSFTELNFSVRCLLVGALALGALALPASASARGSRRITERAPQGTTLQLRLIHARKTRGTLIVTCSNGQTLGRSRRFLVHHGRFAAILKRRFKISGRIDAANHFRASGSTACSNSSTVSEGAVGGARMTACPQTTPETPYPSSTPFTFAGIVPNAAAGTRVRIEFTNPNAADGSPDVVHLSTDAGGVFSVTWGFPGVGYVYGAEAIPRYPDAPLAGGQGCEFEIQ